MFRAIKKKIAALRKDGEIQIPPGREKLFLMLVRDHYNRHPLLEVCTSIEILERDAVVELIGFLNQPGDANLLS